MIEVDRDKLIKCLRMFSSDYDGEVASAARRAHELIVSQQLDWDDLIIEVGTQQRVHSHHNKWAGGPIIDLRRCRELRSHLTEWEADFITSVSSSIVEWGRLTPKQQAVLDRIVNKLKSAGLWDGESW